MRTLCDKSGVLLVLDEIQTGAGRTGTYLYCEQHSVRPDVIALGKGLAGGMPVGATLFSNDVAQCMTVGSHGSTFGGNPLCSRVAYEVARVVSQEEFLANVRRIGQRFLSGLEMLQGQYGDTIRAARGVGLLCALELAIPCHPVQRALAASGLVCTTLGQNSLRFTAPLIIDQQHVDWALEVLDNTFCKL